MQTGNVIINGLSSRISGCSNTSYNTIINSISGCIFSGSCNTLINGTLTNVDRTIYKDNIWQCIIDFKENKLSLIPGKPIPTFYRDICSDQEELCFKKPPPSYQMEYKQAPVVPPPKPSRLPPPKPPRPIRTPLVEPIPPPLVEPSRTPLVEPIPPPLVEPIPPP